MTTHYTKENAMRISFKPRKLSKIDVALAAGFTVGFVIMTQYDKIRELREENASLKVKLDVKDQALTHCKNVMTAPQLMHVFDELTIDAAIAEMDMHFK